MSALEWSPADIGYAGVRGAASAAPRRPPRRRRAGAAAGRVRITRRGRLALLALAVALAAVRRLVGMRGAGAAEPPRTVTVDAGQTLSEVALAELPEMSISEGILAIQLANEMSTAQVSAGQELVIPRS